MSSINLTSLLFGFSGRINRARYWLGVLIVIVVSATLVAILLLAIPALGYGLIAVGLAALWSTLALATKRLHDRNKSGLWVIPFIIIPGILDRGSDRMLPEGSALWWIFALIAVALSLWGLIEIGFRKGTTGDNVYGPDPLAAAPHAGSV